MRPVFYGLPSGSAMIELKYPVLLVHGMGFRDRKRICYWGRIPKRLEREGVRVFFGGQDSNGSLDGNASFLAERITALAAEHKIEKFNVIAHSKGGLEMRKAITHLGIAPYVASLTTVSTPHRGSKTVDFFMKMPAWLMKAGCAACDLWFRLLGDRKPRTFEAVRALTTTAAEEFNKETPDVTGIYYQSFAFTFKTNRSDMTMFLPHLVVKHLEGENDGLVTPESAEWGDFRGTFTGNSNRGVSHCDEVDMRRHRLTKREGDGISDIPEFYAGIVKELAERGF